MSLHLHHVDLLFKVSTDFMNGKNFTFNKKKYTMANGRLEAKTVRSKSKDVVAPHS
jgi:hypothetical protein